MKNFSLLRKKLISDSENTLNIDNLLKKKEIIPFKKLIDYYRKYYFEKCNTDIKRENLLKHFIMDETINDHYLTQFLNEKLLKNNNENNKNKFIELYNILKYPLSKEKKLKYFNYLDEKTQINEKLIENPKFLISNFIKFFHNKISEQTEKNISIINILNEIDNKINQYKEIYKDTLLSYNYPPFTENLDFKYHFFFSDFLTSNISKKIKNKTKICNFK